MVGLRDVDGFPARGDRERDLRKLFDHRRQMAGAFGHVQLREGRQSEVEVPQEADPGTEGPGLFVLQIED